jgi:hypothetical protein
LSEVSCSITSSRKWTTGSFASLTAAVSGSARGRSTRRSAGARRGLFTALHNAKWDAEGNPYVMDWNVLGRISKLKRVKG